MSRSILVRSGFRPFAVLTRLAAGVGAAGLLFVGAGPGRASEQLVEGIAAQVGSEIVLASEVFEMSAPIEKRMREAGAPANELMRVRKEALERLIEGRLINSVVERLELGADREEIDDAIGAIAQENGLSIEQLLSSVTSHGLSLDEYRNKIKGEIERGKVLNAMVRSRVEVTAEEVESLFDQRFGDQPEGGEELYVQHIVVMPDGRSAKSADQACQVAGEKRRAIASGRQDFPAAAREISDMNPERGGELGWLHRDDLAGWMAERLDGMQPGDLSDVISMPFGCNLLRLVDRRSFTPITLEQARPQLTNFLFNQKTEEEYTEWLDVLRGQTFIDRKGAFGG